MLEFYSPCFYHLVFTKLCPFLQILKRITIIPHFLFCGQLLFLAFYSFWVFEIDKIFGENMLFRYLKWLGKNVTWIYIIQWIFIGNTATEVYKTVSSPLYLICAYVIVLLISSSLAYLILKFREKTKAS